MKYKYFTKNDPKKEAVGIVNADNNLDAQKLAARVKKMDLNSLLSKRIYKVIMDLNSFNKIFTIEKL